MSERQRQIADNLGHVRDRIADACAAAGRSPDEVTLTVVTKHFPASDVEILAALGVRDLGENKHQEAEVKAQATQGLHLRWHFVGRLQSNKAAAVAAYADVVESLDRTKLIRGLAKGAHDSGKTLDALVQVNLDPPDSGASAARGGAAVAGVAQLAEQVAAAQGLRLRGVMAVAPMGQDPSEVFRRLADVAAEVQRVDPAATWISAGMSGDLEAAVGAGATHVRIGSAVLGQRPPIK